MQHTFNPFVIQGYQGKDFFCDREEELALLMEHVLNHRNITLFGWRRLGKTALLQHLAEELRDQHAIDTLFVDIGACRDLQDLTLKTVEAAYQQFGRTSRGNLKKSFQQIMGAFGLTLSFDPITGIPALSLGIQQQKESTPSLQALFRFLAELDNTVLIVLDEFQQIAHFKESHTEGLFREFTQTFPTLRFTFSGSHRGIMQSMFTDHNRPFYKSTQLVDIREINRDSYSSFILHHFAAHQKSISKEVAYAIYDWCRGETYSVQLICNRLFSRYESPKMEDFIATTQQILSELKRTYTEWLNVLPYNQVKLLKAIALSEPATNPTSKTFLKAHDLGAASSVQTALKGLMDKEIIFQEEGGYYVHDLLLGKWLST